MSKNRGQKIEIFTQLLENGSFEHFLFYEGNEPPLWTQMELETTIEPIASTSTIQPAALPRIKRTNQQALSDEVGSLIPVEGEEVKAHGGRILGEGEDPFSQNAWDKVEWGEYPLLEREKRKKKFVY